MGDTGYRWKVNSKANCGANSQSFERSGNDLPPKGIDVKLVHPAIPSWLKASRTSQFPFLGQDGMTVHRKRAYAFPTTDFGSDGRFLSDSTGKCQTYPTYPLRGDIIPSVSFSLRIVSSYVIVVQAQVIGSQDLAHYSTNAWPQTAGQSRVMLVTDAISRYTDVSWISPNHSIYHAWCGSKADPPKHYATGTE